MGPDVRVAEAADRDALIDTLRLSFATDPCIRAIWPKASEYLAGWAGLAMGMGGPALQHGTAYVTEDGGGAALWLPPGVDSDAEAMFAVLATQVDPSMHPTLGAVREQMDKYHPHDPHWYLAVVGADPSRQGQGLGSALIKEGLRRCDADGTIAYLESSNPKNVPLYERHGFEVIGVVQPDDYPPLYPMLRAARG